MRPRPEMAMGHGREHGMRPQAKGRAGSGPKEEVGRLGEDGWVRIR